MELRDATDELNNFVLSTNVFDATILQNRPHIIPDYYTLLVSLYNSVGKLLNAQTYGKVLALVLNTNPFFDPNYQISYEI